MILTVGGREGVKITPWLEKQILSCNLTLIWFIGKGRLEVTDKRLKHNNKENNQINQGAVRELLLTCRSLAPLLRHGCSVESKPKEATVRRSFTKLLCTFLFQLPAFSQQYPPHTHTHEIFYNHATWGGSGRTGWVTQQYFQHVPSPNTRCPLTTGS